MQTALVIERIHKSVLSGSTTSSQRSLWQKDLSSLDLHVHLTSPSCVSPSKAPLVDASDGVHSSTAVIMLVSVVLMGLAIFVVYKFKRYSIWGARRAPPSVYVCPITTLFRGGAIVSELPEPSADGPTVRPWAAGETIPSQFLSAEYSPEWQSNQFLPPPPHRVDRVTQSCSYQYSSICQREGVDLSENAKHSRSRWGALRAMAAKGWGDKSWDNIYYTGRGPHPGGSSRANHPDPGVVLAVIRSVFAP